MSFNKNDLKPIHYKLIGSVLAVIFFIGGIILTEMNIIGKEGVYVTLDVQSRFELELTEDLTIKRAILYNEDGGMVTKKLNMVSRDINEAVAILANVMKENNMFLEQGRYIYVGVSSHEDTVDANVLKDDVISVLEQVLESMQLEKPYYVNGVAVDDLNNRLKEMTKEYKISFAKADYIQKLFRKISGYSMNELARMSMFDLYKLSK